MNSPTEPGSPAYSTPSTESPPPEEANYQPPQNTTHLSQLASQITASLLGGGSVGSGIVGSLSGASSKRRQPQGVSSRDRDAKSRRREPRPGGIVGGVEPGRKDKDELVDAYVVERMRKDIGDPFLEIGSL
ncbi:hypothetical protein JOM56_003225 [Amanita muscaria]